MKWFWFVRVFWNGERGKEERLVIRTGNSSIAWRESESLARAWRSGGFSKHMVDGVIYWGFASKDSAENDPLAGEKSKDFFQCQRKRQRQKSQLEFGF